MAMDDSFMTGSALLAFAYSVGAITTNRTVTLVAPIGSDQSLSSREMDVSSDLVRDLSHQTIARIVSGFFTFDYISRVCIPPAIICEGLSCVDFVAAVMSRPATCLTMLSHADSGLKPIRSGRGNCE